MEISCVNDASFGPIVKGCRGDFDFTLKFEKIILSILPSVVFIALSVPRAIHLARKRRTVNGTTFQFVKLLAAAIYTVFQLALLIIGSVHSLKLTDLSTTAEVLSFVTAIVIPILSFLEHSRSPRPSILLSIFLTLTVLCDIVQVRSLWLLAHSVDELNYVKLFTVAVVWKAALVCLESVHCQSWLGWDWNIHSPEEVNGLYGLGTFLWLTPLFMSGYKKVLNLSDLFPLDRNVSVEALKTSFAHNIKHNGSQGRKNGLAKALARTLAVPILLPAIPRIALLGFTICQPFLIETILNFLEESSNSLTANKGYGLIGATILVYTGIPFSTALYWYLHERALFKTRACLASAIYRQTVRAHASNADDAAAVTLMSTDVERVRMGLMQLHEFWANPIQVAIACWLLQRQLGTAFVAPLVVIFICVISSSIVIRFVGPSQTAWMKSIQKRVGHTANVIANMKHLKISGFTKPLEDTIQMLRVDELQAGSRFRSFMVGSAAIGFSPFLLGPVFAFALTSRELNVTTIYTSVSWLQLLTNPLSTLFQNAPQVIAAFSCLSRIELFLEEEPRQDFRRLAGSYGSSEKSGLGDKLPSVVEVKNAGFGWDKSALTLKDINFSLSQGLTMVIGPVACGKSTLCKALLGETPNASGDTFIRTRFPNIGFCDQVPFLPNERIKDTIIGFSDFDEKRYAAVIEATMLSKDLSLLSRGDQTKIGSGGISLSGGQKQRVALARALYLQCDLLILDDPLGGLDTNTAERIFHNLFGSAGILRVREAIVILCTNATRYLPSADYIVALASDGTIVEKGRFCDLVANRKYVHSLGFQTDAKISCGPAAMISQSEVNIQEELPEAPAVSSNECTDETDSSELNRATGDWTVFAYYCRSIRTFWMITFLLFGILTGFLGSFPTIWLGYWSADSFNQSKSFYVGIYGLFQCLALASILSEASIGLLIIIRDCGSSLHEAALRTVISAPLRFFSQTDTGIITNLFSQDMTLIDGELAQALINTSLQIWLAVGSAAVVASSSPYIIIAYPFVLSILYGVQRFYLRTSRQLRLLDLEAKSPLYTHFLDTIKGTTTLRAFGWTENSIVFNNVLLDTSQRPAYQLGMIQRCLSFVLDMVVAVIALLVVTLATQLRPRTGLTGASLVSIMSFGSDLASLIKMYTQLETSIGAVSRIKALSDKTAPEDLPGEDTRPPTTWPERGMITVKNISASYSGADSAEISEAGNLALRDLTFTIPAGQKVAICGRTGSGKSSTVLLLLRLLDPLSSCTGELSIDNISLLKIDRSTLRQCIIAVPQDPTFFPDRTTFRKNLDPFDAATHDECHSVLKTVGLWPLVSDRGGLEVGLSADMLSHGQKQLFNLARAVLRRRVRARQINAEVGDVYMSTSTSELPAAGDSGVLILDEVNSSVDAETQKTMRDIIWSEFERYTVIMVSHRLDIVMEFDKVLVMDGGRLVEEGSPMQLIKEENGWFKDLWMAGNE
ncbi:hypothetical protein N7507_004535 [Penicillium longicatenatum]|nr:hypothetical protein N7507_004535 [Penicillium longicatenatum]